MDYMFWVWLGVIVVTFIVEMVTMEIASIWFTIGAIIPFILAGARACGWEIQVVVFVVLSAILIASLRNVTKKYLLRNSNEKTNLDSLIGQHYRMLERTDFETIGSVKVNDVVWSAVGENQQVIEKGDIVEICKISGNKLIVKKVEEDKASETEKKEVDTSEEKAKVEKPKVKKTTNKSTSAKAKTKSVNKKGEEK